jgi:MFS family permease
MSDVETARDVVTRNDPGARRARTELLIVGLAALTVSLSQSILVPVLGQLTEAYGPAATWMLTSTMLVASVCVPVMGRLADMYGKRLMLLVALAGLVIGSLIDAVSSDLGWLIAGRAVQGVSSAAVPLGISLLATTLPRERVAGAVALISSMLGIGGALALPLAGLVAQNWDWTVLCWMLAAAGAASFIAVLVAVPEAPQRSGGKVDLVGTFLLSVGLVALILPLAQSHEWGWGSPKLLGLLALSAVVFVVFGIYETHKHDPLVDLAALRRRPILLTNLASVCFGFALFASFIGTPMFVEAPTWTGYGMGASLFVGGLAALPSGLMMLAFSPVAARLVNRWGAPQTLALGAVIVGLGWVVRIVLTASLWEILIASAIMGIGTGIGYSAIPALINANTPVGEIAAANGLNTLFRNLGSTLASAIGGSILASSLVYHVVDGEIVGAASSLNAYRWLFAVCAIAAFAAAALVMPIRAAKVSRPREAV